MCVKHLAQSLLNNYIYKQNNYSNDHNREDKGTVETKGSVYAAFYQSPKDMLDGKQRLLPMALERPTLAGEKPTGTVRFMYTHTPARQSLSLKCF